MEVIMPQGAFGAYEGESDIETALRVIAEAASTDDREWANKYGTQFENETFMMHPYCWCESAGCLWCDSSACGCPDDGVEGYLDGVRVPSWYKASDTILGDWKEYRDLTDLEKRKRLLERDERLKGFVTERIHVCEHRDLLLSRPRTEGTYYPIPDTAPNFWYKPSGLKVWWYKYIGRGLEQVGTIDPAELVRSCLVSLGRSDG